MESPGESSEMLLTYSRGALEGATIRHVLDSMSDSLLVFGENGEIIYANKVTEDILGYSAADFRQQGLGRLPFLSEENYDFNQVIIEAIWKKSINNYSEVDYRHPDGRVKRLAVTTSYLIADGEHESTFIGFIALFKDITEVFNLRRKEKELVQQTERIAREKISSLHKLAMGVAHEIRNPMVTIGGFAARILRDSRNPEDTRIYAKIILEDAKRLEKLVNKIQQYCNLPEARLAEGDPAEVTTQSVFELGVLADNRKVEVRFHDLIAKPYKAKFDGGLLKLAISNLLENAIEFSPEGGTVDVLIHLEQEGLVIEVIDTGPGIPGKDLEFIFNPFFSTRIHRSGMGLALVERIVNEHMGKMEVASIVGKGTTMRVILPRIPVSKD